jgi:hypothetical protein
MLWVFELELLGKFINFLLHWMLPNLEFPIVKQWIAVLILNEIIVVRELPYSDSSH